MIKEEKEVLQIRTNRIQKQIKHNINIRENFCTKGNILEYITFTNKNNNIYIVLKDF